jgi:predicted glycoside hydrolase/deacetylase ChbG (UPF0249 family)
VVLILQQDGNRHLAVATAEMLESAAVAQTETRIRLVVNADGFGTSDARNRGVLAAHRDGIVTSTSVVGNASDPAAVMTELAAAPQLGTGILLALSGGEPVAPPNQVPTLLAPDGGFPPRGRDVVLAWAKAALRPEHVEREFDAQVARWRDLGLRADHLSVRDQLGCLPMVAVMSEKVARRHGVPGLRLVGERPTLAFAADLSRGLTTLATSALGWYGRRHLGVLRHGPKTWGQFEAGRLDEVRLLEILGRLGPGCHELLCSPDVAEADSDPARTSELYALTSDRVRAALQRRQVELCRWSDLF